MTHFAVDGHIDTTNEQKERAKRDTYRSRGKSLVNKGQDIENLNECEVNVDVIPTWENEKRCTYTLEGYNDAKRKADGRSFDSEWSQNEPATSTSTMPRTPDKKSRKQKTSVANTSTIDPETCQICKVKYKSPEDIETDSHQVNCGSKKGSNWWVHTICANIHYRNNDEGEKKLDAWASKHFYCKKHMLKAEKIGWDNELNREVQMGKTSKKSHSILKLKKKIKK